MQIRTEPTADDNNAFLACWPPGIARLETEQGDAYGLVMRKGEARVWASAATWPASDDAPSQADAVAAAVLTVLAETDGAPLGAAAFVRPAGSSLEVGVAVFAFAEGSTRPGADRPEHAQAVFDAVAERVGEPLGAAQAVPYDELGRFHLEAMASSAGVLLVSPQVRAASDPTWAGIAQQEFVHFPSVGFVDESDDTDAE